MTHPLDGCRTKIERANKQIKEVERQIHVFLASEPDRVAFDSNPPTGKQTVVLRQKPEPPLMLSVLIGEIAHHLRSIFDHIVWQLVIQNGSTPTEKHMFPVCDTPEKYARAVKRGKIKGVSSPAHTLIETLQFYEGADIRWGSRKRP